MDESLVEQIVESLGKASLRFMLSTHPSSHNLIYLPWKSIFKFIFPLVKWPNFLQIPSPKTISTSFSLTPEFPQPPYFESSTSLHRPIFSKPRRQIHFPNKAILKRLKSIIPSPLSSFGSQTFFHEAHAIFQPSDPHPHKKFLYNLTISFITIIGILYKDNKIRESTDNTNLIRQSLAVIEINLPFHLFNPLLTLSTTSS